MCNLSNYYTELLKREGVSPRPVLTNFWPNVLSSNIEAVFINAVSNSQLKGTLCPILPDSRNQSIGNQVEKYTIDKLNQVITNFEIRPCSGSGYPDKTLVEVATQIKMPLEVKATSKWDASDSNRRVLTSSSKKLRQKFNDPIYHLLMTVLYTSDTGGVRIDSIRLDFLEPTTTVDIRLEASVNHKILSAGSHHISMI